MPALTIAQMPLPLAQISRRARNAKNRTDTHLNALFLDEATIKLVACGRVASVLSAGLDAKDPLARQMEQVCHPSLGQWNGLARDCGKALGKRQDRALLPLALPLDSHEALPAVRAWAEAACEGDNPPLEKASIREPLKLGAQGFFDLVTTYRNKVLGHGAVPLPAFLEKMGPLLLAAAEEVLGLPSLLGGLSLAFARLVPDGNSARLEWSGLTGTASLGLTANEVGPEPAVTSGDPRLVSGQVFLVGPGVRLGLHPLIVYVEDENERERVGFLNGVQTRKDGVEVKKSEYLDYATGESLRGIEAKEGLRAFLARLKGRDISADDVERIIQLSQSDLPEPETGVNSGSMLGDFLLEGELGRGAFGVVYRARQQRLGREVAIKVLPPMLAGDPVTLARFRREIRSLGRCDHPNLVRIITSGQEGDRHYYVMELVEGIDLEAMGKVLSQWHKSHAGPLREGHVQAAIRSSADRRVQQLNHDAEDLPKLKDLEPSPAPVLAIGRTLYDQLAEQFAAIADALAHLHGRGILHRDIKPSNIMISHTGRMVLMDLGLARLADKSQALTATSAGVGSPLYMAPEQLQKALVQVDDRADIYSLGATLYELLTHAPVFHAESREQLYMQILHQQPKLAARANSAVPRDLESVVMKCLEKDRTLRYATAIDLRDDLNRFCKGESVLAKPAGRLSRAWRWAKSNPVLSATMAVAVIALLGVATGSLAFANYVVAAQARQKQAEAKQVAERVAAMVQSVPSADINAMPRVVQDLADYRDLAEPLLLELLTTASGKPAELLRVRLALAPWNTNQLDLLLETMQSASSAEMGPAETLVVVGMVAPYYRNGATPLPADRIKSLWESIRVTSVAQQRLRAAAALAALVPADSAWKGVAVSMANDLARVPSVHLALWLEALRPVRTALLPPLAIIFQDKTRSEVERTLATDALADWAADNPSALANLLMDSDQRQFEVMFAKLQAVSAIALPQVRAELEKIIPSSVPSSDLNREKLANRQANAAVALARLGEMERIVPLLTHSPDPRVRSYIIHALAPQGADPELVIAALEKETEVSRRRALLLALGEFGDNQLNSARRKALVPAVESYYRNDPDPGVHAAAEWLLRQWKQEKLIDHLKDKWVEDFKLRQGSIADSLKPNAKPGWFVNRQKQTMVLIPGPVEFQMGSPVSEENRFDTETSHKLRIGRSFAIASTHVTLQQYERFKKNYRGEFVSPFDRDDQLPVAGISWFMAAAYCNWLSEQEGIDQDEWCFEITNKETRLKPNYLKLKGYRLPTEAEMEYTIRAGGGTSRFFGETSELLPRYAWYLDNAKNKPWPVGMLKPNDLGVFDAQGNVFSWCMNEYRAYSGEDEDSEEGLIISKETSRVLRGTSFILQPARVRSAYRLNIVPAYRDVSFGFRAARTLDLD